ncbi:MAG TPA: glycosyltransferase [Planctomycetota bacterium]
MRILQISEPASAGVGRHLVDLSQGLLAAGHDVHLVYSKGRMDATFASDLAGMNGLASTVIAMRRAPHPSDLLAAGRLRSYLRKNGPFDIVHGQSSKGGALARLVAPRFGAVVYTPHCVFTMNPDIGRLGAAVFGGIERWLGRRSDAVIAVSKDEAAHLRALGLAPEIVHCVPNGLHPPGWRSRDEARRELGVRPEATVVGFLGRMSPQKNPVLLVQAFARLASSHPDAVLAMVGDGPLEADARAAEAAHGLAGRILWLGFRRPVDVMPAFDVFALPSRYEGLPYVLLEAVAAGLPIVSTPVGGSETVVQHDANGLIVAATPESFADGLGRVIGDRALRDRMAASARLRAEEFSVPRMVERTLEVYASACDRRRRRSRSA